MPLSHHLLTALLALAPLGHAFAQQHPQPDILLIMPDQMRGDCLSALGHPVARTPQVDALAEQGALFRRAYATVPSCIPARHAFLTGLFPQTTGIVGFASRPITARTLPQQLAKAGYATVLVGRNMHQVPANASHGYQTQILGSTYVDDDDYDRYLRAQAPESGGIRAVVKELGVSFNGWEAKPWPLADELHPTAWVGREASAVVAGTPADRPLFLTASFYAPHSPLFPPRSYFDACLQADLPEPAHGDWVDWGELKASGDQTGHRVRLQGKALREAQAGYFGLIRQLDDAIAPLIAAFRQRSEAAGRPWVIVFTSDHGELLGDHGFYRKCEPYEGSANIPLVIAGSPGLHFTAGLRAQQPVCLEDLMPTLLDLAGTTIPEPMDGVSLVPVLRGEREHVRDWLHFEHADCYSKEQAFHALTDGHVKYVWRPLDGSEQLFDLDDDPREEHDLSRARSQRKTLAKWRGVLVQVLEGRPEGFSDGEKLVPGRPYPALPRRRRNP